MVAKAISSDPARAILSIIAPNSGGAMLKPVETKPKTLPTWPRGVIARISMSRDGDTAPAQKPPIASSAPIAIQDRSNTAIVVMLEPTMKKQIAANQS